jgi:hypothetical protein
MGASLSGTRVVRQVNKSPGEFAAHHTTSRPFFCQEPDLSATNQNGA